MTATIEPAHVQVIPSILLVCAGLASVFWFRVVRQVDELLRPWPSDVSRAFLPEALASSVDVELRTDDGLKLRGWFLAGSKGTVIVLAHGHGANRTQMVPEAAMLARHGFGVLLFDWRAHGESEGAHSTRGDLERLDLAAAVDYAAAQLDVTAGGIGGLGFSRGGSVLIALAASDARIRAVAAQAASPSIHEALLNDIGGPPALTRWPALWAARRAGIDTDLSAERMIGQIAPRPLLLIHGTDDAAAPMDWARRLHAAAGEPKRLWLIDGAGHGDYSIAAGPLYERKLVDFFDRALLHEVF